MLWLRMSGRAAMTVSSAPASDLRELAAFYRRYLDVLAVRTEGKSLRCIVTGGWHPTVSVSRASYNDCLTILAP